MPQLKVTTKFDNSGIKRGVKDTKKSIGGLGGSIGGSFKSALPALAAFGQAMIFKKGIDSA